MKRERYSLLDALRGLSLISMVLYHMVYDIRFVFGVALPQYSPLFDRVWQQSICWTFLLLSGICWHFSRSNLRRGLTVFCGGLLVTLVTVTLMPSEAIHFGILSCIGASMLLCIPLRPLLERTLPEVGIAASFALFLLTYDVSSGHLGILRTGPALPGWLYQSRLLVPFGLPAPGFWSSDYFPLLPWFFLFLTGYFLWAVMENRNAPRQWLTRRVPVLSALGRHSLLIYLLHQPLLMVVLTLVFRT